MDLDSFASLDGRPLLSELFHHFLPDEEGLVRELIDSLLRLPLELVQPEAALDHCRLRHQELEVGVGDARFVRSPVLLDNGGCKDRTLLPFEHEGGNLDPR